MCIGIPMRVVESLGDVALCEGRGASQRLDMLIVGPQPPGTWVLAFQGAARRTMGDDEAAQTNAALDALDAAMAGEQDFSAFFADLVDREPELPAHLRRTPT